MSSIYTKSVHLLKVFVLSQWATTLLNPFYMFFDFHSMNYFFARMPTCGEPVTTVNTHTHCFSFHSVLMTDFHYLNQEYCLCESPKFTNISTRYEQIVLAVYPMPNFHQIIVGGAPLLNPLRRTIVQNEIRSLDGAIP